MQKQHFSHRHPLERTNLKEETTAICSGCELQISGKAYKCTKPTCDFHLHKLCFNLPQQIHHSSHPKHPLSLSLSSLSLSLFSCKACSFSSNSGFIYHCPRCNFHLHLHCAALPSSLQTKLHKHPLSLLHSSPEQKMSCRVCDEGFPSDSWAYCCSFCEYGLHVDCAVAEEEEDGDDDDQGLSDSVGEEDGVSLTDDSTVSV